MTNKESTHTKATILHIIPDERLGGPQGRVLQVAKGLKTDGFISIVAMPDGDRAFASLLDESNIAYYQLKSFKRLRPTYNPAAHLVWLFFFIPSLISLIRLIRRNNVNIVHVNGHMYLQGPLAARLSGAKLVWHLNDVSTPKLIRLFLIPFLHFLPHAIAVSSKAVAIHDFGKDGTLVNNVALMYAPVDASRFYPCSDAEDCREYRIEFGLKDSDKVIGTIGNVNPTKGYEYFLLAAKMIKDVFPYAKFLVVGKRLETAEKYWQRLQALVTSLEIEGDVIFTGARQDIPKMMNTIDIFVLSSSAESFSMATVEAMACAKPVVATRVGGLPEVVTDGETGILVPPKDSKAIADAVLYLLNHPEEAKQMGIKGRQRAAMRFNVKECVQKHRELYEFILASASVRI